MGSGNRVRKSRKPPPHFRASHAHAGLVDLRLKEAGDKSARRVRPRKKRNLSSNRWPTAQLWLQNANEMIRNSSSARGIRRTHQASRSCHRKHSRPTFHTDPPETQSGWVGWGAADAREQQWLSSSWARMGNRAAPQEKSGQRLRPGPVPSRPQCSEGDSSLFCGCRFRT